MHIAVKILLILYSKNFMKTNFCKSENSLPVSLEFCDTLQLKIHLKHFIVVAHKAMQLIVVTWIVFKIFPLFCNGVPFITSLVSSH